MQQTGSAMHTNLAAWMELTSLAGTASAGSGASSTSGSSAASGASQQQQQQQQQQQPGGGAEAGGAQVTGGGLGNIRYVTVQLQVPTVCALGMCAGHHSAYAHGLGDAATHHPDLP